MLVLVSVLLFFTFLDAAFSEKRIVLHSESDVLRNVLTMQAELEALKKNASAEFAELKSKFSSLENENTGLKQQLAVLSSSGYTAGGHFLHGSGSTILCLPEHPSWNKYDDHAGHRLRGQIYGVELDISSPNENILFGHALNNQDMPCSVCRTHYSVTHMFPGHAQCPTNWSQQYTGYLVSGMHDRSMNLAYYCLDADPEPVPHGGATDDQCVLYIVESKCGSLPCPPYVDYREVACTVCSK